MVVDPTQPQAAMTSTSLIGPAVVAAFVSAIVAVVGFFVSAKTARSIHAEKLAFDREQAERRMTAEVDLARKKIELDRELAAWKRQTDFAEQLIAAAYEARDGLEWARAPAIFGGEGETRQASEAETDEVRQARNSAFIPIERLSKCAKGFEALQRLQYPAAAHFGVDAKSAIGLLLQAHNTITSSASHLVRMTQADDDRLDRQALQPFWNKLWGDRPDALDKDVGKAVAQLESICKPVLAGERPA